MVMKLDWKGFLVGTVAVFILFQFLSIILANWFPSFAKIVQSYQIIWMWVIMLALVALVGTLLFGIKSVDKKTIFIVLLAIAVLSFIIIKYNLDLGRLFNMSVIRTELASLINMP